MATINSMLFQSTRTFRPPIMELSNLFQAFALHENLVTADLLMRRRSHCTWEHQRTLEVSFSTPVSPTQLDSREAPLRDAITLTYDFQWRDTR